MTVAAFAAAVAARDLIALDAAGDGDTARQFIHQVLPQMGSEACRWFWSASMTTDQLRLTSAAAREVMTQRLIAGGFELGQDFSAIREDGIRLMLLTDDARSYLLSESPADRHSSLLAFTSALS